MPRNNASVILAMAACCMIFGPVAGCGGSDDDDDASLPGCGSDSDCKGDRICVKGECVNPGETGSDGGGGESDGGGSGGEGGTGEAASGGGGAGGSGGAGQTGGSGGASGSGGVTDQELEAACVADCDAITDAGCESTVLTNDQCVARCLLLDASLQGYCFKENRDFYRCKADGGYECLEGQPIPHSSCLNEQTAVLDCTSSVPCRKYCRTAVDEACAEDENDCLEGCLDERKFQQANCAYDYDRLLNCWADRLVCVQGRPSIEGCEDEAAETADCVARYGEYCDGFCWAADLLGCGSGSCLSQCNLRLGHQYCGTDYRSVLLCAVSHSDLNMECKDGEPVADGNCATQELDYQECMKNSAGR